jgi:hypothetical protein
MYNYEVHITYGTGSGCLIRIFFRFPKDPMDIVKFKSFTDSYDDQETLLLHMRKVVKLKSNDWCFSISWYELESYSVSDFNVHFESPMAIITNKDSKNRNLKLFTNILLLKTL